MKTWFFHHSIQGLSQSEKYLILVTSFLRPQHLPPVQILRSTFDSHFSSVCPTLVFHLSYHQTFVGFCVYICLDTFVWDFNVIFMCQWRFSYEMFPQQSNPRLCPIHVDTTVAFQVTSSMFISSLFSHFSLFHSIHLTDCSG